jgi:hypothetical protein
MHIFLIFLLAVALPKTENRVSTPLNPLVDFDPVWNHTKYNACNTAKNIPYLTTQEKEIIFVLNLVRQYPAQFNKTIVSYWPEYLERPDLKSNKYFTSLVADINKMKPVGLLKADSLAWISARCHAYTSGKKSYVGHERQSASCKVNFSGECCHYGGTDPAGNYYGPAD